MSLHKLLSEALHREFDCQLLGYENITTFLQAHFSKILEFKKEVHKGTGLPSIFVVPRSHRGGMFQYPDAKMDGRPKMHFDRPKAFKQVPNAADSIDLSKQSPVHFQYGNPAESLHQRNLTLSKLSQILPTDTAKQVLFKSDFGGSYTKEGAKRTGPGNYTPRVGCWITAGTGGLQHQLLR